MKFEKWQQCILLSMMVLFVVLCAARPCMGLMVSEVMYHPAEGQSSNNEDEVLEFIELYNNRAVFEDLSGYAFTNGIEYTFETGTIIGPKEYLVVARNPDAIEAIYGISSVYGPFSGRLSNDGERVELSNNVGEIIISFRYDDEKPWPISPDGAGHSLILAKLGADPEEGSSWSASTFIGGTPGGPDEVQVQPEDPMLITLVDIGHIGRYFKGSREPSPGPDEQATTDWTELGFNDAPGRTGWFEGPSGYGYSNDDNELQYIRTQLNYMNGNYISVYARLHFNLTAKQTASFTQLMAEVHYDDDYVLYLNGVRVGASDGISGDPPPFNAGRGSGHDPDTVNVDLTNRIDLLVPGNNVLAIQAHNASISGSSDCMASLVLYAIAQAAEGMDNPHARVIINELLADSDSGVGTDWIEIYNPGPISVDLSNVYLSDSRSDLLKYKIPDGIVLEPCRLWSVGEGTSPNGFEFALSFSGETVYLTAATGGPEPEPIRVLDAVRYGAMKPDVTFGRFPDGADYMSILSSATFNGSNAQPYIHDIVINEIMYHHSMNDERYEYIELYNRGTDTVSLAGWAFTDGIEFEFAEGIEMLPDSYLVIAKDPEFIEGVYDNLITGSNLLGPFSGVLNDRRERIRLSCPLEQQDVENGDVEVFMVTADEVTYFEGGRWPAWADGEGASMELRDPYSNNDSPDAWADSDESGKTSWEYFSFSINSNDSDYTHGRVSVFDMMLLNRGEILLDDLQLNIAGANRLTNNGFESGVSGWRILGNHVQSFVTTEDQHSGSRSLHLIATGHGDPGANRINKSITSRNATSVTFSGWARWLRGSRFLLMRASQARSPVQPPWPSHAFELDMPLNLGTPGMQNTAYVSNRGPDILEVRHSPVLPADNEPIVVTARVIDNDGVGAVTLYYRSEGSRSVLADTPMIDNGTGDDMVGGDGIFTAVIPGASDGTLRAFYIMASDLGSPAASTRFPTLLQSSADVPDRTCLVRVGDTLTNTPFATYRVWISDDVVDTFRTRPTLSNELLDCTFVYNDTEVFYNTRIRHRGSPWLRSGFGREPYPQDRRSFRIDFNPDHKFREREEINLDSTEGASRGPLQERASYWFHQQMGLLFSRQEYVRLIINGRTNTIYEDVQKVDGDYIDAWFPDDADGRIHKVDDYFEYSTDGTQHTVLDEGLVYDSSHPLLKETYRWCFEKRSHPEDDNWDNVFDLAVALNTPSNSIDYEQMIESVIHPEQFARLLALRRAVGDWDSYGYRRGKNNYFYYAPEEGMWYFLPWDIDFTLGGLGDSATHSLFTDAGHFPEVNQFLDYPKYHRMYLQAFAELVSGPWQTSYGTNNPPTAFDIFLDDAADALIADGSEDRRRDEIKRFVRDRRNYILTQIPSLVFEITTNGGVDFCTSDSTVTLTGIAPLEVGGISVNGTPVAAEFSGNNEFEINVPVEESSNFLSLQGLDGLGNPVSSATDSITVTRVPACSITSVTPSTVQNNSTVQLTIQGSGFQPGTTASVMLKNSSSAPGFNALYVQNLQSFDSIDDATTLLNNSSRGRRPVIASHTVINLLQTGDEGLFSPSDQFAPPFNSGDPSNFAVRFSGYISVPTPGTRFFGVNSDDGFALRINNFLVGEYAFARAPQTTDCVRNRTAGTMAYNFRSAGSIPIELDFYENGGGEEIEFFQTDSNGGDQRLINVDSKLVVFRDEVMRIDATDVVIVDEDTITCRVNVSGIETGLWNVYVTPECGEAAQFYLDDAINITE